MSSGDIFLAVLAILFPPIAVWIKVGLCTCESLLNLLLCCLGWLPGLLHAWYIIASYQDPYDAILNEDDDLEGGSGSGNGGNGNARVTYYVVTREGRSAGGRGPKLQQMPPGVVVGGPDGGRAHRELQRSGGSGYGTLAGGGQRVPSRGSSPQPPPRVGSAAMGEGATPPTYDEAVKGDHKVQTS